MLQTVKADTPIKIKEVFIKKDSSSFFHIVIKSHEDLYYRIYDFNCSYRQAKDVFNNWKNYKDRTVARDICQIWYEVRS